MAMIAYKFEDNLLKRLKRYCKLNIFQRIFNKELRNLSLTELDRLLDESLSGRPSKSGINISNDSAMAYSAVFNAVQIIAGTIASLPLILYRRTDKGKERAVNHPLYDVLHNQPNDEMTSYTWRESMQSHLLLQGNAYSHIARDGYTARPLSLWPLHPQRTNLKREGKKLVYLYREDNGEETELEPEQVFHIPGLGFDGHIGYSVLTMARESMGLGLAMESFNALFYGQGTNIGNVFQHPGKLGKEAHEALAEDLDKKYAGLGNAYKAIILEEGMEWKSTSMPLQDAQFIESRVFQISEIARWFNLPPHKLKELSKATFSNIEQQQIEFVQDTIRPWLVRWEQHLSWKLLLPEERKEYFFEFLIDGLLRGDMESRNKALAIQRQNGVINANDWLSIENRNPIEGKAGTVYWMPLNMTDANAEEQEKQAPPGDVVEEDKQSNFELRGMRSINTRRRFAQAFKPIFRTVAQEILKIEIPSIKRIAKKSFTQRDLGDFKYEIDEFYRKTKPRIRKLFATAYIEYGNAIYPIAAAEVNSNPEPTEEFQHYVNEFIDHTTNRYVGTSQGQLNSVASEHRENDIVGAIDKRLIEWGEKRPDKVANREVIDGEAGFASFVYFDAGFRTVWVAIGDSCPYCNALNGKTVSRGIPFIGLDEVFQPEGADVPLVTKQVISHPAAHGGCDCTVRASL